MREHRSLLQILKGWNWWHFWRGFLLAAVSVFVLVGVPAARPDVTSSAFQSVGAAREYLFDFATWEASTLLDKGANAVLSPQSAMTEEERIALVRTFLERVAEIQRLDAEILAVYADPNITDPEAASAELRAQREALRQRHEAEQALAEAVIQSQVSEVIVEYGFGVGGQLVPPVAARFTQLPTVLILSPRDRIERTGSYALEHGITVDERERIEREIDAELGVSSLIVPIGGLAVWPSMIIETSNLPFTYEVVAHEWLHHYLAMFPLGFNYGVTPELFTMNETTANIFGKEIGWAVLDRYYPDLAPPPPDYTPQPEEILPPPLEDAPTFDFRAEMRETRVRVDELLLQGRIGEAEAYMEERREVFVENGYLIRKLNQAYFAFYGSYADTPGATGSDPVGPMVRELRFYSPDLETFIETMRGLTTISELEAALEEARAGR